MAWTSTETLKLLRTLAPYRDALERIKTEAGVLNTRYATILARHVEYGALDSAEEVESTILAARQSYRQVATQLIDQCRRIIQDQDAVVSNLAIPPSSGFAEIAAALVTAMGEIDFCLTVEVAGTDSLQTEHIDDLDTLYAYIESFPLVADAAGRQGSRLLASLLCDGISAPAAGVLPLATSVGRVTQSVKSSESLIFELTADSQTGGRLPGQELYRVYSQNTGQLYEGVPGSSGTVNNIATAHQLGESLVPSSLLCPPFTVADVPDGWTVVAGTPGTEFEEDATNLFRGASTLAIAANQTFELTKTIASAALIRNGMYVLYWWERAAATGAPVPTIADDDVSSSEGLGDAILTKAYPSSGGGAGLQAYSNGTNWRLRWKLFRARTVQPQASYTISLASAGTNTACSITSIGLAPVAYHAGFGYLIIPGDTDPLLPSSWPLTASSTIRHFPAIDPEAYAGGWARFFNEVLGIPILVDQVYDPDTDNPLYDQVIFEDAIGGEDLDVVE